MRKSALQARVETLEAEVARLRASAPARAVTAGETIKRGALLVVDVVTLEAFTHGPNKTIPNRRKVWGTAKHRAKKGEPVAMRHWFCDEDCGPECHLCASVNPAPSLQEKK